MTYKNKFFLQPLSIILVIFGFLVMLGWWLDIPELVHYPGEINTIKFNTGLCLCIIGVSALCNIYNYKKALLILNIILLFFCTLLLSEYILPLHLKINTLFYNSPRKNIPELFDYPGRVAINTLISFDLIALFFIFKNYGPRLFRISISLLCIFLIYSSGVFGVAANLLKLSMIFYNWYDIFHMATYTGICLIIVAGMLWSFFTETNEGKNFFASHALIKAAIVNISILIVFLLIVVGTSLSFITDQLEDEWKNSLIIDLEHRKNLILQAIDRPERELETILQEKNWQKTSSNKNFLATKLIDQGFAGIIYENKAGEVVSSTGHFIKDPVLEITLNKTHVTKLLWKNGFYLQIEKIFSTENSSCLVAQWPLNKNSDVFDTFLNFSNAADMVLCTLKDNTQAKCFPTRLRPFPFQTNLTLQGKKIAMYYPLHGQHGAKNLTDYRGRSVIAAYTPLGNLGLGIVLKIDIVTAFSKLHSQLARVLWLILLTLFLGTTLLTAQIYPILKKILSKEKEAFVANRRLQAIMNSSSHIIISTDLNGTIKSFNPAAERALGYSAEELVDKVDPGMLHDKNEVKAYAEFLSASLGRTVQPNFEAFIAKLEKNTVDEKEWTYIRKDGSRFPIFLSATALRDSNNKIFGYVGIAQDITERKKIDVMKNEFISMVSHELRTPLTSILGSLSLLLNGAAGQFSEKANQLLHIAKQNSERLTRLINNILDIEKIETGKIELNPTPIKLADLLSEAMTINQPYADQFKVSLQILEPIPNLILNVDKDRILQVITNFLSNAIKYSPNPGVVSIGAKNYGHKLCVFIKDHGPGIPLEFQNKIFQKFAQADSSSTRGKSGTGLGLSICKAIIEQMHGNVGFETQENQGTTFFFNLPENLFEVETQAITLTTIKNIPNILHIENEIDISLILADLIQENANIVNVNNLHDAKIQLKKFHYDLVILDLNLPDGQGADIIPDIFSTHTPILVFSAYALPEEFESMVEKYLPKSKTSNETILETILAILKAKK